MNEECFKGFPVSELLDLWWDLQSDEGALPNVPKEKFIALNEYLRLRKKENTVFSTTYLLKRPLF